MFLLHSWAKKKCYIFPLFNSHGQRQQPSIFFREVGFNPNRYIDEHFVLACSKNNVGFYKESFFNYILIYYYKCRTNIYYPFLMLKVASLLFPYRYRSEFNIKHYIVLILNIKIDGIQFSFCLYVWKLHPNAYQTAANIKQIKRWRIQLWSTLISEVPQ